GRAGVAAETVVKGMVYSRAHAGAVRIKRVEVETIPGNVGVLAALVEPEIARRDIHRCLLIDANDITQTQVSAIVWCVDVVGGVGHAHVIARPVGVNATGTQRAFGIQPRLPVMAQQGADTVVVGRPAAAQPAAVAVIGSVVIAPSAFEKRTEGLAAGTQQ